MIIDNPNLSTSHTNAQPATEEMWWVYTSRARVVRGVAMEQELIERSGVVYGQHVSFRTLAQRFDMLLKRNSGRTNIVAEGDSWFSFTGFWKSSLLSRITRRFAGGPFAKANVLRLESPGEEATEMFSDSDSKLSSVLSRFGDRTHLILLSGGGNDLVKDNLRPIVRPYENGMDFDDCIDTAELDKKLTEIAEAYKSFLSLASAYAPNATAVCHTYDHVIPGDRPFQTMGITKGPWIHPVLVCRGIPEAYWTEIARHLLRSLRAALIDLQDTHSNLQVVDTQETLVPLGEEHWEDEMHPTKESYELLAARLYSVLRALRSDLPEW